MEYSRCLMEYSIEWVVTSPWLSGRGSIDAVILLPGLQRPERARLDISFRSPTNPTDLTTDPVFLIPFPQFSFPINKVQRVGHFKGTNPGASCISTLPVAQCHGVLLCPHLKSKDSIDPSGSCEIHPERPPQAEEAKQGPSLAPADPGSWPPLSILTAWDALLPQQDDKRLHVEGLWGHSEMAGMEMLSPRMPSAFPHDKYLKWG